MERPLAAAQLVLAMFGMGAVLTPPDFAAVFRRPRALALGFAVQLVLVPLLAWLLGRTLPIDPGVGAGLVLVAAVPGGSLSNVFTYVVGGNVALSVSLTAVTTLAALATTPAVLAVLIGGVAGGAATVPAGHVARDIMATLILPVAAGMGAGARLGPRRDTVARWCVGASFVCIVALAVVGARGGRLDPGAYGLAGFAAIVLLAAGAQAVAFGAAAVGRLSRADGLALAIEATIRNTNLALLVQASLFAGATGAQRGLANGTFFVALLYGGVAVAVACLPLLPRLVPYRLGVRP